MKNLALVSALVFVCAACGEKSDRNEKKSSLSMATLQDSAVQGEVANALASEALSAASGGEASSTAASFALYATDSLKSQTRTCEGNTVKIVTTIEHSVEGPRGSIAMTGSGTQTRLWKMNGEEIACANGRANIGNMEEGLSLYLTINRSREMVMTRTNPRGVTFNVTKSHSLEGSRYVEWTAVDDSATELLRTKKIFNSDMTRAMKITKKNGDVIEASLNVKIDESGIIVKVKRDAATKKLLEKEIVSGEVTATLKDGSEIVTSYTNLKFSVSEGKCSAVSGQFSLTAGESVVSCEAAEGALSCKNAAGEAIEVEAPMCDPEDAA